MASVSENFPLEPSTRWLMWSQGEMLTRNCVTGGCNSQRLHLFSATTTFAVQSLRSPTDGTASRKPAAPPSQCATLCSRTGCVYSLSATLLPTVNAQALQYTLFANASLYGTPPVRALFFEFPQEPELLPVDRQFMIGSDILVTPVLTPNVSLVSGEFHDPAWYIGAQLNQRP